MKTKKLSERTINALELVITGNSTPGGELLAPYRSGLQLVAFFNEHGRNDSYGNGFPSRHTYAKDSIRTADVNTQLRIIESALDPAYFLDFHGGEQAAVDYLNKYLKFESLQARKIRNSYKVTGLADATVEFENSDFSKDKLSQEFIDEQIYKCRTKISNEDYDGAITNARSLVEAVLRELEIQLGSEVVQSECDLVSQYNRVRELLNLEPKRTDISNSLRQVLTGLTSVVNGLAPIRNRMSDAHARSFKPTRHHAKLAANSAQTIADFLVDSFHYQVSLGLIEIQS